MQKIIVDKSGNKVGEYFPITGNLVLLSGTKRKLDKESFKEYCQDMAWEIL